MIFKRKTGGSAGGGKAELVNDLFPELVVRNSLAASFLAYGFVKFEKIKLLSSDLGDLDLSDAFGTPILAQVFLKFTFLF